MSQARDSRKASQRQLPAGKAGDFEAGVGGVWRKSLQARIFWACVGSENWKTGSESQVENKYETKKFIHYTTGQVFSASGFFETITQNEGRDPFKGANPEQGDQ